MIKTGIWQNENGSLLDIKIKNNLLSGKYKTNSENLLLQKYYPIKGYTNNNLISFCVDWEDNQSMTSWSGKYVEDKEIIKCHWHLVRNYSDIKNNKKSNLWESFLTGVDIFTFLNK